MSKIRAAISAGNSASRLYADQVSKARTRSLLQLKMRDPSNSTPESVHARAESRPQFAIERHNITAP